MPPEHVDHDKLIEENEPTADESIDKMVRNVLRGGDVVIQMIADLGSSRELSLAKTNIEQAMMWVARHHAVRAKRR